MASGEIFNPLDPAFVQDPYPAYRTLRDDDPVHRSALGYWVVTRYEDIVRSLGDSRLSNAPAPFALVHSRNRNRYLAAEVANDIIPFKDPPAHTAPRGLIAVGLKEYFRRKQSIMDDVARELLKTLRDSANIEFVSEFSVPFAVRCISRIMGLPQEDERQIKEWSGSFFYLFQPIPNAEVAKVNASLKEFRDYMRAVIEERRRAPRDDLVSALLDARRRGYSLSDDELVDNSMLLLSDGIENVQSGLAIAVATLLRHPDQMRLMMERPELIAPAIEECLRYDAPGQYQGRIATEDIEMGGKTIKARSIVFLVLASGNRDPRAIVDPDAFRIDRQGFRHLSFGAGRHSCIGGPMVGVEFHAALAALFDGSRSMALLGKELDWIARAGHRWPAKLPLAVERKPS